MSRSLKFPFTTSVDGEDYQLYLYEYFSDGKVFGGYIYSTSMEDAEQSLADLKASAHIAGQVEDVM